MSEKRSLSSPLDYRLQDQSLRNTLSLGCPPVSLHNVAQVGIDMFRRGLFSVDRGTSFALSCIAWKAGSRRIGSGERRSWGPPATPYALGSCRAGYTVAEREFSRG